jgi:hypothetical protein
VALVAHPQQLVRHTNTAGVGDAAQEKTPDVLDNELFIDNSALIGAKGKAGTNRVNNRKDRLVVPEFVPSSSTNTAKQDGGRFTSSKPHTVKNEDKSGSGASSTRTPYVPSYTSMNNAKKKKDNGNEFMRTRVKHFDDWLRRMKRSPLSPRSRGADGKYTISRFKQKSEAIKALTSADDKSLLAFIKTKEEALDVVEQTGTADPSMYDGEGMLVIKPDDSSSRPRKQPLNSKKRGSEELGGEDGDDYSGNEEFESASSPKQHCTSRYV